MIEKIPNLVSDTLNETIEGISVENGQVSLQTFKKTGGTLPSDPCASSP